MYVCLCEVVTDSDIHDAVKNGVRNMRQLADRTGCSSNCGRCARTAVEVLDEALRSTERRLKIVASGRAA